MKIKSRSVAFLTIANLAFSGLSCCAAETYSNPADMQKGSVTMSNGSVDEFAVATDPEQKRSGVLLVYLHGSGSNFTEPFRVYELSGRKKPYEPAANIILRSAPGCVLLSPNYGGVSWGSDASLRILDAEIHKMIEEQKIEHIILFGNSMGASVAMVYAAQAAPDIQARLLGLVACQATTTLSELIKTTKLSVLPSLIETALGASVESNPKLYDEKSPAFNLSKIPKFCKLAFVNAQLDNVVPFALQTELANMATKKGFLTRIVTPRVVHGGQPPGDIRESIEWILQGRPKKDTRS